jgi:hypothetical protein
MGDLVHQPTPGSARSADEWADRARFISASPRMARALLKRLGTWAPCLCHLTTPDTCDNCVDRAMLREAGVL